MSQRFSNSSAHSLRRSPKSALARAIEALQPAGRGLALGTGLGLLACSPLAFAQSDAAKQESSLAEVTVSATGMAAGDMATPVQVLGEEELRLRRAATLGETLAAEPGINASHFGAGASRP
jgi:iron complex outermembrane receptor protein